MRSRRDFLIQAGQLGLVTFLGTGCQSLARRLEHSTQEMLLLATRPGSKKGQRLSSMVRFHSQQRTFQEISIPFMNNPHSILKTKMGRDFLVVIPNGEAHAHLVDQGSGELVRRFQSKNPYGFYGHGALSKDENYLFLSEPGHKDQGRIAIFDFKTGQYIDDLPGYGIHPHEIHLIDSEKVFVMANNGYKKDEVLRDRSYSSLSYVDAHSGRLLDKVFLKERNLHITHLAIAENGDVAMGMDMSTHPSKQKIPAQSVVAFRKAGQGIEVLKTPKNVLPNLGRHVLSVAYDAKTGVIGATNQYDGGPMTLWSSIEKRYLKTLPIKGSSGINFLQDKGVFLVSSHYDGVYEVSPRSLSVVGRTPSPYPKLYIDNHSTLN